VEGQQAKWRREDDQLVWGYQATRRMEKRLYGY